MKNFFLIPYAMIVIIESNGKTIAAEVCRNTSGYNIPCIERLSDTSGNNSCGENCSFRVINQNGTPVLHIYKPDISKPATIRQGAFSPKYYIDNQVKDAQGNTVPLQNIVFDNDIETLDSYAFADSGAQISNTCGKFNANNGHYAYLGATVSGDFYINSTDLAIIELSTINGNVIVSDNVERIGNFTFGGTTINGNLVLPSSINQFNPLSLSDLNITGQIYCAAGAETCYKLAQDGCNNDNNCLTKLKDLLENGKFSSYPDGCTKLNAGLKCTKCKSESFKLEDGWCLRKHYTPAEAAEVLKDTDNEIIMTFKVNR